MPGKKVITAETKTSNRELYGKRIRQARKKAKMTAGQLAEALGVSQSAVKSWENGYAKPDLDSVYSMFSVFGVDPNTFYGITGVGTALTEREHQVIRLFRDMEDTDQRQAVENLESITAAAQRRRFARILNTVRPVENHSRTLAAGNGDEWEDYPETTEELLYTSPDVIHADEIMTITGDSMEPKFHDGDKVLVQYTDSVAIGDVGAFYVPGLGGVIKERASDRLHSLNPAFDDIFPYEDGAKVIGKVLRVITEDMIPSEKDRQEYALALEAQG